MTTTTSPPAMRFKNAGRGAPEVDAAHIEALAIAAAQEGKPLADACPYPFNTQAGEHFTAVWFVHSAPSATIHARPSPAAQP